MRRLISGYMRMHNRCIYETKVFVNEQKKNQSILPNENH